MPSHEQRSPFFPGGRTVKKRTKVLPKPWPPDHALRKVEELCAILRLNVTIALSVSAGTFFLFELRRPVPLDLFQQHGPDALNQPNAIRGHGQELLGRINPGFDKYACCPRTEPTFCKRQCPVGLAVSRFTSGRQPIRNEGSVRPRRSPAAVCSRPMRWKVPAQTSYRAGLGDCGRFQGDGPDRAQYWSVQFSLSLGLAAHFRTAEARAVGCSSAPS